MILKETDFGYLQVMESQRSWKRSTGKGVYS